MPGRNLGALRRDAAFQDRSTPAFAPYPRPNRKAGVSSGYVPPALRPDTLDELEARCGDHALDAVEHATLCAVITWTLNTGQHAPGANAATFLRNEAMRRIRGETPKLPDLNPWQRRDLHRRAGEVLAEWQRSGAPHLLSAIRQTHGQVQAVRQSQHQPHRQEGSL